MKQRIAYAGRRFLPICLPFCLAVIGGLPALAETGFQRGPGGETICAPRAKLLARLEQGRGFALQGQGLRDAEAVMEVRADPDGNWLLLQNYADGLSCLLAMGEAWEGGTPVAPQMTGPAAGLAAPMNGSLHAIPPTPPAGPG